MIEKILQWCGIVFAAVGIVCLFLEAIGSIRKRNNTKLSILSLIFLTISLVGYIVTEVVLRSKGLPSFFSVAWVVFLWAYLICNLVSYLKINKKNRALKREQKLADEQADNAELTEQTEAFEPATERLDAEQTVTKEASEQIAAEQVADERPIKKRKSNKNKE